MVRIQFPGQTLREGAAIAATVRNGLLVEMRERSDLSRLIELCGEVGFRQSWPFLPGVPRLLPGTFRAEPFSQLIGALMAGAMASPPSTANPQDPEALAERVLSVSPSAETPFDGLLIALTTIYQLWNADADLVVLLGLEFPADRGSEGVSVELARPQAALWSAPGSLLAGISVATTLKVAKWCSLVIRPFTSTTAETASKRLVERLRDLAQARSRHPPLPRLDALSTHDRAAIQARPVLIVFLHGLFGTDLHTFDGFISQLQQSTPAQLLDSLQSLQGSTGTEELTQTLRSMLTCERAAAVSDIELRRFVDANVALLGWPHDSLAGIDTSAIRLAALLDKELKASPPRHVVFVCHSQGGLLARETALQLKRIKSPACWERRIGGIVTFGTPHDGAAIAEPGFQGGREAAVYLMMLSGTRQATSLADVLTLVGERAGEGIEDLKSFNASTKERETAFVTKLLEKEMGETWPNGRNRPDMVVVGGKLDPARKDSWRRKLAAGFVRHKLDHDDHDLVVELSSSLAPLLDVNVGIRVESDHVSYFDGQGRSKWAVDVAVASVWTLLGAEIGKWCDDLAAADKALAERKMKIPRIELAKRPPPGSDAAPGE